MWRRVKKNAMMEMVRILMTALIVLRLLVEMDFCGLAGKVATMGISTSKMNVIITAENLCAEMGKQRKMRSATMEGSTMTMVVTSSA